MSGAQYGICGAFSNWKDYKDKYVATVRSVQPVGSNKALLRNMGKISGNPSMAHGVVGIVADQLDVAIKDWQKNCGSDLSKVVILGEDDYDKVKLGLLQAMNRAVGLFVEANNFNSEFRAAKAYERAHPRKSAKECIATTQAFCASI